MRGRQGRRCKQLLDKLKEKEDTDKCKERTRSHSVENSLPKRAVDLS